MNDPFQHGVEYAIKNLYSPQGNGQPDNLPYASTLIGAFSTDAQYLPLPMWRRYSKAAQGRFAMPTAWETLPGHFYVWRKPCITFG